MRQTHVAGEKLFVDWAGDAIPVFDPITGAEHGALVIVSPDSRANLARRQAETPLIVLDPLAAWRLARDGVLAD
jgi:hypothetical protein